MTNSYSHCQLVLVLDRQVPLESLVLNRLQRIPANRQQEWLRGLLMDGFRLACHALHMTQREGGLSFSRPDTNPSYRKGLQTGPLEQSDQDSSSVDAVTVLQTYAKEVPVVARAGHHKPFAQLSQVLG